MTMSARRGEGGSSFHSTSWRFRSRVHREGRRPFEMATLDPFELNAQYLCPEGDQDAVTSREVAEVPGKVHQGGKEVGVQAEGPGLFGDANLEERRAGVAFGNVHGLICVCV